ncbi:MAG: exosome complex RNA-binding protein Rrp4 [Methanosarcina flavescens]|jgi:exosome complex component RRP4|uniref:Exosome complex component Rrp4 n=1 Tax=Methanosarcina flavescens TaxID=1715806 RepID=A0A660HP87_9EURY|nr:exosome complex RNA-binding protein Rrp4 [Methanosarcina flavescens]AYK13929.1 S1 RNA-binding domain-containing protein [Methanosarcina flavescens]NLK32465.1 S1 RNA-binding domain-containing protein [Methanosarcina flavescens]
MDKKIVIPGDLLSENSKKAGYGTYVKNDKIYSLFCGIENLKEDKVGVIPLAGAYIPSVNDVVIGVVIAVTPSNWIMDIASPYDGLFHVSEYPRRIQSQEMSEVLDVGDSIILRVKDVDSSMKVELALRDSNFHKLKTGHIVEIEPVKVPRVIGHGGSMISMLKKETNCSIFVGQNGRIWIDGKDDDVELLSRALRKIEAEAQRSGLTDRVYNFLKNERSKQKESKPAKFFKSGKEEVKLPKEDHSEEIYRKIDVLLDPKN